MTPSQYRIFKVFIQVYAANICKYYTSTIKYI